MSARSHRLGWGAVVGGAALCLCATTSAESARGFEPPSDSAQLDLIQKGIRSHNPKVREAFAARLDAQLGPRATRRAISRSFRYRPYRRRVVESMTYTHELEKLPWLAILPRGYDPARSWPMHIHLHGGGFVSHRACRRFFTEANVEGFILLCPTTPKARWWLPEGEEAVLGVYRDARRHFNVDTDRVSLGGGSSGATGTWHLGHKFPWLWSALVPRCGGRIRHPRFVTNLMQVPVFMIHGAADKVISVDHSRQMAGLFEARRKPITYREVEGGGHDFFPSLNAEVLPWMVAQRRTLPRHFVFEPTRHQDHGIIHWLEAWPTSRLEARLTTSGQGARVQIQTEAPPRKLAVYLNDDMADLDKPVQIVLNGEEVFSGAVSRSTEAVLHTFQRTFDVRRTFSVVIRPRL